MVWLLGQNRKPSDFCFRKSFCLMVNCGDSQSRIKMLTITSDGGLEIIQCVLIAANVHVHEAALMPGWSVIWFQKNGFVQRVFGSLRALQFQITLPDRSQGLVVVRG